MAGLAYASRNPYTFSIIVGSSKMALADLTAQTLEAPGSSTALRELDWRRVSTFAAFGAVQIGVVQQFIFSTLMPGLFPLSQHLTATPVRQKFRDFRALRTVLAMTLFHELTVTPFLIFPAFYTFRELMQGDTFSLRRAIARCAGNALEDNMQSLKIFVPANFVNFLLVPPWLRSAFATAAGVVWASLLSSSRGKMEVERNDTPPSRLALKATHKTTILLADGQQSKERT